MSVTVKHTGKKRKIKRKMTKKEFEMEMALQNAGKYTRALVEICNYWIRPKITPEKLCSFFRGNLPENSNEWLENPEWYQYFKHMCRFFEKVPEKLIVKFLEENELTPKDVNKVLHSVPECFTPSDYIFAIQCCGGSLLWPPRQKRGKLCMGKEHEKKPEMKTSGDA